MKALLPKIKFKNFDEKWNRKKLHSIAPLRGGFAFKSEKFQNTGIPVVRISNIKFDGTVGGEFECYSKIIPDEKFVLRGRSILLAMSGATTGKIAMLDSEGEYYQNQRVGYFQNTGEVDYDFLSSVLQTKAFTNQLNGVLVAGAQPNISSKEIDSFEFCIPDSIDEQSAIGSLFRTLDDLLSSYKDNLTNYQALKATMLSKMFPKAGQTVPEIRLDGFEDRWEEKEFIQIVNRVTESSDSDALPKVEFEDIISGQGKLNKDISSKFDNRKGILFKPGYTLYGKLRPYLNNWLLPKFEGVALGDFWVFDPNGNNSDFIYYLVQSSRYQKVANDTSGTKMPRSDWKSVSTTVFAIPQTIAEQQAIGAYFSNLDNLINSHQEKISQLEILKKKLLQDMFI